MCRSIEALRFFFICIICLWHCKDLAPYIHHGYIAVEFFFILSGYLIYKSWQKHPEVGAVNFILRRVKIFAIPYLISVFMLMIIDRKQYFYISDFTPDGILNKYFLHFHEFFFCQNIGLTSVTAINHPMWYLSTLLWGGGICYSLLRSYKQKAIAVWFPVLSILGFQFLLSNGNCSFQNTQNLFGLQSWFIRGVSEISFGILVAYIHFQKSHMFMRNIRLLNGLFIVSMFAFFLMCLAKNNYDYLSLFFVALIIITCFTDKTLPNFLFRNNIWLYLGRLSLYMYIIHLWVASVYWIISGYIKELNINNDVMAIVYLMIVILLAILLKKSSNFIENIIFK